MATMVGKGDYRRFWALLRDMPGADKDEIVWQFTGGRTTHLHLMTEDEYRRMLRMMDGIVAGERRELLRKRRRICLKLLQEIGVDTGDWTRVNAYCANARIAGRAFGEISAEGLKALAVKLRAILRRAATRQARPAPKWFRVRTDAERAQGRANGRRGGDASAFCSRYSETR